MEEFGVKIGSFEHVLEGYKVADEIAKHGAGASTFSDWWAYKFEVYDAIPYNGSLMRDRGVLVSLQLGLVRTRPPALPGSGQGGEIWRHAGGRGAQVRDLQPRPPAPH